MGLKTKAGLIVVVSTLAMLAAINLTLLRAERRHMLNVFESGGQQALERWALDSSRALKARDMFLLEEASRRLASNPNVAYLYLAGPDGRFLAHSVRPWVGEPLEEWRRKLDIRDVREYRAEVPLPDGAKGTAVVAMRLANIETPLRHMRADTLRPLLYLDFAVILLATALSLLLARHVILPVQRLERAAAEVARGKFDARVPAASSDELGALSRQFNEMAVRLGQVEQLKSDFLGKVTHDLRSPLGAVMGYAQVMLMEIKGPLNAYQKDALNTMLRNTKYLSELVNNILDMTKIEAGRMTLSRSEVDLRRILDSVATLMRPLGDEYGVSLAVEATDWLPSVYADQQALTRVLINLVSNALKFTPKGGKVSLLAAPAKDGGVQAGVRDTGIGIPPEKLSSVFAKFVTIHQQKDLPRRALGTGLGLAICKEIVEAHGGRIWVASRPGQGTTFAFFLPPPPPAAEPVRAPASASSPRGGGGPAA